MLYKSGKSYDLINPSGKVTPILDREVHIIQQDNNKIWLEEIAPISPLDTKDGLIPSIVDIIKNTWNTLPTDQTLSIMLSGISGMGKTKCAHTLASVLDLPIILCRSESIDTITQVIGHLCEPVLLLFDEYEKHHPDLKDSELKLTFFDGVKHPVRLLNVLTLNDNRYVSEHMFNRPGRILYNFQFNQLTTEEAVDFVINKARIDIDVQKLTEYVTQISNPSFDICDKLVEVIKMFPDSYENVIPHLNISTGDMVWTVEFRITHVNGNKELLTIELDDNEVVGDLSINGKKVFFSGSPITYIRDKTKNKITIKLYKDFNEEEEYSIDDLGITGLSTSLKQINRPKRNTVPFRLIF